MRANFIFEKFTEDSDPIHDMGIGTIEAKMDIKYLKKLSIPELRELYKRVHNQEKAQIRIDGYMFDTLSRYMKIYFSNLVAKALNYNLNIEKRNEVRKQAFKPGDAVKCKIKEKWHIGYVQFSKRGIVKTDNYGRIAAKTLKGILKIPLKYAVPLTPKEQKIFDKEFFNNKKEKLIRSMNIYKDWSPSQYKIYKEEYDELMRTKKVIT